MKTTTNMKKERKKTELDLLINNVEYYKWEYDREDRDSILFRQVND